MRLIVFFDLPVKTSSDRKSYRLFRKYLISKGFFMIQYSIYTKILYNRDQATHIKNNIRNNVPSKGNVRIMLVTEKQYASMEVILGGISNQEEVVTDSAFILL